jgi:predicted transcriptional regulator of viral defense system
MGYNISENVNLEEVMTMASAELRKYTEQKQVLSVAQAVEDLSISPPSVYRFIQEEGMERLSRGLYAYPDTWIDEMKLLADRSEVLIFSHESALLLHDLTDREPPALTVTVPSTYNASHLTKTGVRVFYVKPDLLTVGKTELLSPEGNSVPCYDLERTICDLLRSRSQIDQQVFLGALKAYARRPDKRLDHLSEYAKFFRVTRLVSQYLEVLL